MNKVSIKCNYPELGDKIKRLEAVNDFLKIKSSSSNHTKNDEAATYVLFESAIIRNRGLTQVNHLMSPFTATCSHNPPSGFFQKNTNRLGALVCSDLASPLVEGAYFNIGSDDAEWIRTNFCSKADQVLQDATSKYPVKSNSAFSITEAQQKALENDNPRMFHTFDPSGTYCIGRVFRLEILEEAVEWSKKLESSESSADKQSKYPPEFLKAYLACYKNLVEHPFEPVLEKKPAPWFSLNMALGVGVALGIVGVIAAYLFLSAVTFGVVAGVSAAVAMGSGIGLFKNNKTKAQGPENNLTPRLDQN